MKQLLKFIKNLLIGGIVFFIPLIILIGVIGKGFKALMPIIRPYASFLEGRRVFGLGMEIIISIGFILLIIMFAGMLSRMAFARMGVEKIENAFLTKLPGYSIIKSMLDNVGRLEEEDSMKVVIAEVDDGWKFGFLTEELKDGKSAVFLPDAPHPWSGSLVYLAPEQITRTDIPITVVMKILRTLGQGFAGEDSH